MKMSAQANCLSCSDPVSVAADAMVGEITECRACGQEHEILGLGEALSLGLAPEVEEDWGE
jgi:alpha-aminoadipate carrier protein LysW